MHTTYHYDIDSGLVDCDGDGTLESTAKDCYKTKNNRLMFYEVRDAAEELLERVDYQYEVQRNHVGNPTYIVRRVVDPQGPDTFYATTLQYNQAGELWFVGQQSWPEEDCYSRELVSLHEFRTSGRAMRMTRQRDPDEPSEPLAGTTVWHDYDGDAIYGDVAILGVAGSPPQFVMAETFSHEPGVGQFDVEQTALSFYHGDQIGSLRAVTGDESGDPPVPQVEGRIVYTAFGELAYQAGVGQTRYGYCGAWGYEAATGVGGYVDPLAALGWLHVGERYYDPASGRFTQRDPIGIRGGLNVYVYCSNSPIMCFDPDGEWIVVVGWIAAATPSIAGIVGMVVYLIWDAIGDAPKVICEVVFATSFNTAPEDKDDELLGPRELLPPIEPLKGPGLRGGRLGPIGPIRPPVFPIP